MVPLKRGVETDLIEIPASWYLDDLPPMMFIKKAAEQPRLRQSARTSSEMWRDQFDWVYREMRLRRVPDHHPPGCRRAAAGAADAGAARTTT